MDELPGLDEHLARGKWSETATPWAVTCDGACGLVFLSQEEYDRQMYRMNSQWKCPKCGGSADWSDEHYERFNAN